MTQSAYYHLDDSKLATVLGILRGRVGLIDRQSIEDFILADWSDGIEHQGWLNTASAEEIAEWIPDEIANPHLMGVD